VVLRNEDIELELDALGAKIIRAKLLRQESDAYPDQRVVLFSSGGERTYEAHTGLVMGQGATAAPPNHTTPFRAVDAGPRSATFVAESGGLKLTKTYQIDASGF
jgi:YidC/Oxa1 family membrane protein insertase